SREKLLKSRSVTRTNCKKMIHVISARGLKGKNDVAGVCQELFIPCRDRSASLGPLLEIFQLRTEHRSLDSVHAVIMAYESVLILFHLPVVAQAAKRKRKFIVVGCDRAGLTERAEVFPRIKAEAPG